MTRHAVPLQPDGRPDVRALTHALGRPPATYLTGPMRGLQHWNADAFDRAAAAWVAESWTAVNPVEFDRLGGFDPRKATPEELEIKGRDDAWLRNVMTEDLAAVFRVEALALLPGWEKSVGATVEVGLAQFLGLPLFSATTMTRLCPRPVPWFGLIHLPEPPRPRQPTNEPGSVFMAAVVTHDYGSWDEVWRSLPLAR
jgi:hypothetical protein